MKVRIEVYDGSELAVGTEDLQTVPHIGDLISIDGLSYAVNLVFVGTVQDGSLVRAKGPVTEELLGRPGWERRR